MPDLRAYHIEAYGIGAYFAAPTRARARYLAALQIEDAGWSKTVGQALVDMRCHRAPERDLAAFSRGYEGALIEPAPRNEEADHA
jgi:hypothetical protein